MSSPVKPLEGYVFVKQNEAEAKTASGILLPENAKDKPKTAKVVSIGNKVTKVKVGDNVIFKDDYQSGNVSFPINKEEHTIVHVDNIVAVVE